MPTYEYQCSKCGAVFETFQRMSDPPLTKCEKCGAKGTVSRLIGAGAGLIFKGSGFYITDYKRGGATGSEREKKPDTGEKAKESGEKTKEKAGTSSSSESKSASESSSKKS